MIRKVVLGLVSAVALIASANAADIYRNEGGSLKDAPEYYPVNTWTGFYLGGHAGYGWGNGDVNIPAYPSKFTVDTNGFVGGVHGGYNWQTGHLVLGVEADFSGSTVDGNHISGGAAGERYKISENWRSSVRGRLGYAFDRTLIYATGGAAFADVETSYLPGIVSISRTKTLTGFTVGGGLEHKISPNWSLRGEYLFTDYGNEDYLHLGTSKVDYQTNEVRVGLTYHFGHGYEPLK